MGLQRARSVFVLLVVAATWREASAYCAREDGPLVRAARAALRTGEAEAVLIWLPASDEQPVLAALKEARAVRSLGKTARRVADTYFVETAARLHCLALDEAFLGVAPAGYDFGPALLAAERAVEDGEVDRLVRALQRELDRAVRAHFQQVQRAKQEYGKGDRDAGRRYALAYLDFVDFAAAVYGLLRWGDHAYDDEPPVD